MNAVHNNRYADILTHRKGMERVLARQGVGGGGGVRGGGGAAIICSQRLFQFSQQLHD